MSEVVLLKGLKVSDHAKFECSQLVPKFFGVPEDCTKNAHDRKCLGLAKLA